MPGDALGRQYRAIRTAADRGFARVRILDTPELSSDALLDAIDANGEVHGFLKNPAVARGVDMDAVDGVPYVAWSEANGRTLAELHRKCRSIAQRIPVEHALLIAEKVATALDHAYNTTIEGDRTLHGLVWPGFVDDLGRRRDPPGGLRPGARHSALDRQAAARARDRPLRGARGAGVGRRPARTPTCSRSARSSTRC